MIDDRSMKVMKMIMIMMMMIIFNVGVDDDNDGDDNYDDFYCHEYYDDNDFLFQILKEMW